MRNDRLDPRERNDYLSIQHVERYQFACRRIAPGSRVLDIACGTAYGTAMLRDHGCSVVACDLDPDELSQARRYWGHDQVVSVDIRHLAFADESFDAVVSFETIEHVVEGQQVLDEIHRVLRPGGLFVGSTPNIAYTAHPWYHPKEYEPEEYFALVARKFGNVERFGQYIRRRDRMFDVLINTAAKGPRFFTQPARWMLGRLRRLRAALIGATVPRDDPEGAGGSANGSAKVDRPPSPYAVISLRGTAFLRIMVSSSMKEADSGEAAISGPRHHLPRP